MDRSYSVNAGDRTVAVVDTMGRINLDNMRHETETANEESVWWGILAARARRRANDAKLYADIMEAQIRKEVRAGCIARGEKFTVDSVDDSAHLDPRYREAREKQNEAEESADVLESAKYATVRKASMIEELAPMVLKEVGAYAPPGESSPRQHAQRQPVPASPQGRRSSSRSR